jgi:hypothetical protein
MIFYREKKLPPDIKPVPYGTETLNLFVLDSSDTKRTPTHYFSPENQFIKSCYLHTPILFLRKKNPD